MSENTVEKQRKRSWPLYFMLRKSRYKTWITSHRALFHLLSTTGKMKMQHISSEKRRKDADVLEKASKASGVMIWMEMSPQGLTKPFFVWNQRL
ncbi:uncharacterized protein TNCV_2575451 [Trichonephila clavipes]|uniref:Uncharacterized protein n=1 Tax=Trichonephila clavipes TaxID=2585209 RepID=A0A8X6R5L4_TRICX|nr:uncharacterized protein TNCV_2575451 [Trichonephila clavipes]